MKLVKKIEGKPVEPIKVPKVTKDQEKLYKENNKALLPRGKYQGYTLGWVKENDKSYYQWLVKEGLIHEWSLVVLKEDALQVEIVKGTYLYTRGEKWIELREVNESSTKSIYI